MELVTCRDGVIHTDHSNIVISSQRCLTRPELLSVYDYALTSRGEIVNIFGGVNRRIWRGSVKYMRLLRNAPPNTPGEERSFANYSIGVQFVTT